jgi:hypothetical protein
MYATARSLVVNRQSTGEILRHLTLDYQPTGRPPHTHPQKPQQPEPQ